MQKGALAAALLVLAGCLQGTPPLAEAVKTLDQVMLKQDSGGPSVLELVGVYGGANHSLLYLTSTGFDGIANVSATETIDYIVTWKGLQSSIRFVNAEAPQQLSGSIFRGLPNPLAFGKRVAFANPSFPLQLGTTCAEKTDGDIGCGLDEPSIVVDGRGWIYYTAACCFLVSSPVFVSKDGGAKFESLANPFKDAYGNEGDVWLDSAGNLYYMDIDLATYGIAQWDKDLKPAHGSRRPGVPLVDRPWIRATTDGKVFAIYNTGASTVVYQSDDHGKLFTAAPTATLPQALGVGYSDSRRGIVGIVGSNSLLETQDNGKSWGPVKPYSCAASSGGDTAANIDEAGTLWILKGTCVTGRRPDGSFTPPVNVAPAGMRGYFSWIGAGGPGKVAVAWYGRVEDAANAARLGVKSDEWNLYLTVSMDADSKTPHWATVLVDPEPVGKGQLGRRLGDFMQVAIAPNGGIHIAYARNPEMDDSATAVYIGTAASPVFAPSKPLVGPYS